MKSIHEDLIFGIFEELSQIYFVTSFKLFNILSKIKWENKNVRKSSSKILLLLLSLMLILPSRGLNAQISFARGAEYKFLKGKDAVTLSATWNSPGFNDSGWATGIAPFRYGDGVGGTLLSDMLDNYSTLYVRGSFTVSNAEFIEEITIAADFDDGFILWINGNIAASENAPSSPAYNSFSTDLRESGFLSTYTVPAESVNLIDGVNTIAVQGFNTTLTSSDFYFDMSINAETTLPPLPRVAHEPVFSHKGGFYAVPFTISISSPGPEYTVTYTLDGSNPETSPTRIQAGNSVDVLIDPLSSVGRPITPAVIVRAALTGGVDLRPSFPEGRTYIFTSEVIQQSAPGDIWPSTNVNGQIIDLPMDSKVANDPRYSDKLDYSLKAIPSVSIITDIKSLFDPALGIYVNAEGHGEEWERECSAELINPDGSEGFQINAGLRIRGGWSRHDNYPKHAFRLFFRSDYGESKLDYPLFGDEGVSKFDKIDFRCEQNYSWANAGSGGPSEHNTAIREVFSRDTQRDMGQPYSRSRYYHLYLNGMYWGLYQSQERTEANFAASYLDGDDSDYDVVKVNTENFNYVIEATDGTLDTWQTIWNLCSVGFESNTNYYLLEGKNSNGVRVEGAPVLVDIDNLIDYMMVIFYTGNFDSPTSSFGGNKGCNNFFAISNRVKQDRGFIFCAHDAEHSLMSDALSPGIGLEEDRVNLASRTDGNQMEVYDFQRFHPQWLHEKLTKNAEYRMRFADRAYTYFRPGNVLSPEACKARFDARAVTIEDAIIAESARWGDSKGTFPVRTKDDHWIPELNEVRSVFFPGRDQIIKDQLEFANLLPALQPSIIKSNGVAVTSESIPFEGSTLIALKNPQAQGLVYYTLDNSDPRSPGGAISPTAIKWTEGNDFTQNFSSTLKTRVYNAGIWSAMNFTTLLKTNEDFTNLKVTELMYHPPDIINGVDTVFGTSLEFIEFKNTGNTNLNISGMKLDSAVRCVFPENTILGPQQFFVAASKPGAFTSFYGMPPSANFSGNLSNAGEYVLLTDSQGIPVISFIYSDKLPWPVEADGDGNSLNSVDVNPTGNPNDYRYWKASNVKFGTPFANDGLVAVEEAVVEDINVAIYPNPTSDLLNISFNSEMEYNNVRVKIYNMGGVLLYHKELNPESPIRLSDYGIIPGVYLVRLEGKNFLISRRLVVTY